MSWEKSHLGSARWGGEPRSKDCTGAGGFIGEEMGARGSLGGRGPHLHCSSPLAWLSQAPQKPTHTRVTPPKAGKINKKIPRDRSGAEKIITGLCPGGVCGHLGDGDGDRDPPVPWYWGTSQPSTSKRRLPGGVFTLKTHKNPWWAPHRWRCHVPRLITGALPLRWGQIQALGGGRDERAAGLVLLDLNYSLEKTETKRQEAPPKGSVGSGVFGCLVRRCFPFFYSLFPFSLLDGAEQTPPPHPVPPHCRVGGAWHPCAGWDAHGVGIQVIRGQTGDTGTL